MATQAYYADPLLTAEQFLAIDFGEGVRAELDNGVVRMTAGGTAAHARVQGNILRVLYQALRGSGCRPFNPDMALQAGERSVRYPDVSVYCGEGLSPADDGRLALARPEVLFEILSAGTARTDLMVKLEEYKALPSVATIVFVDAVTERVRVVQRTGPHAWTDVTETEAADVALPSLDLLIPHDEIFARD